MIYNCVPRKLQRHSSQNQMPTFDIFSLVSDSLVYALAVYATAFRSKLSLLMSPRSLAVVPTSLFDLTSTKFFVGRLLIASPSSSSSINGSSSRSVPTVQWGDSSPHPDLSQTVPLRYFVPRREQTRPFTARLRLTACIRTVKS